MSPEAAYWQMEQGIPVYCNVYADGVVSPAHRHRAAASRMARVSNSLGRVPVVGRLRISLKGVPDHPVIAAQRRPA